jgi:hypothetical protein
MGYKNQWVLILLLVSALFVGNVLCNADNIEIENVKLRIIDAKAFSRISEYFTGRENQGRRIILRTDPEQRGGLYFIIRFSDSMKNLPRGLNLSLDYYAAGSGKLNHCGYEMPYPLKPTNKVFAGITSSDTIKLGIPIAWRIQLLTQDGSIYSELKSYLWEMPDTL